MAKINFHLILPLFFALITAENFCSQDLSGKCLCGYGIRRHTKYLYVADCARNDLKEVPNFQELPPNINVLDVTSNKIQILAWKSKNTSVTLKWFIADYNEISEVTPEFLANMPLLSQLYLSHNKISNLDYTVFKGVPALHHLDISFNNIQILPPQIFLHQRRLKFLDLSYNNLGVQLNQFKKLLDANIDLTRNLTHLAINGVNVTNFDKNFFQNMSLLHFSAADNNLKEIPRLPKSIEYLDLSGNLINDLNVQHLDYGGLKTLILNRLGYLTNINNYAFYNLVSLETLSLEHSDSLEYFNPLAFGVLLKEEKFNLTSISLDGSGLKHLNHTYSKLFRKLTSVNLANNPWFCDCHILWFNQLGKELINKDTTRCMWPRKLLGTPISNLTENELPRCSMGAEWRSQKLLLGLVVTLFTFLVVICGYLLFSHRWRHNPSTPISERSPYNNLMIVRDQE